MDSQSTSFCIPLLAKDVELRPLPHTQICFGHFYFFFWDSFIQCVNPFIDWIICLEALNFCTSTYVLDTNIPIICWKIVFSFFRLSLHPGNCTIFSENFLNFHIIPSVNSWDYFLCDWSLFFSPESYCLYLYLKYFDCFLAISEAQFFYFLPPLKYFALSAFSSAICFFSVCFLAQVFLALFFPKAYFLYLCHKWGGTTCEALFSGPLACSVPVYWSKCLFVSVQCSFVTVGLYCGSRSAIMMPTALLFLCRMCWCG